jgi:hypothetical protein
MIHITTNALTNAIRTLQKAGMTIYTINIIGPFIYHGTPTPHYTIFRYNDMRCIMLPTDAEPKK